MALLGSSLVEKRVINLETKIDKLITKESANQKVQGDISIGIKSISETLAQIKIENAESRIHRDADKQFQQEVFRRFDSVTADRKLDLNRIYTCLRDEEGVRKDNEKKHELLELKVATIGVTASRAEAAIGVIKKNREEKWRNITVVVVGGIILSVLLFLLKLQTPTSTGI